MNKERVTSFDLMLEMFHPGILGVCRRLGIVSPSKTFGADKIKDVCFVRLLEVWLQEVNRAPAEGPPMEDVGAAADTKPIEESLELLAEQVE